MLTNTDTHGKHGKRCYVGPGLFYILFIVMYLFICYLFIYYFFYFFFIFCFFVFFLFLNRLVENVTIYHYTICEEQFLHTKCLCAPKHMGTHLHTAVFHKFSMYSVHYAGSVTCLVFGHPCQLHKEDNLYNKVFW